MADRTVFSQIITNYRERSGASQMRIAELLGISQATVSRIQRGLITPGKALASKIRDLQKLEFDGLRSVGRPGLLTKETKYSFRTGRPTRIKDISLAYLLCSGSAGSGDICTVRKTDRQKILFMFADAVGSGSNSSRMAFALDFGVNVVARTLNPEIVDPKLLISILRASIDESEQEWLGSPSIAIGTLDAETGSYRIYNSGLPPALLFSNNEIRPNIDFRTRSGRLHGGGGPGRESFSGVLEKGDAILFVTDGVFDLLGTSLGEDGDLKERFARAAKFLKGDAEAILQNLKEMLEIRTAEKVTFADDASVLIIARKK